MYRALQFIQLNEIRKLNVNALINNTYIKLFTGKIKYKKIAGLLKKNNTTIISRI